MCKTKFRHANGGATAPTVTPLATSLYIIAKTSCLGWVCIFTDIGGGVKENIDLING